MTRVAHFEILDADPTVHEFVVRLQLSDLGVESLDLTLPAWIPGSYMIRDFARNVTELDATDGVGQLPVRKTDKQTWRVEPCSGDLVVTYRVYAFDLSVRSAFLDDTRGFFNGTSLFLRPSVSIDDWRVTIGHPTHASTTGWSVHTTLPAVDLDELGFGQYAARDYQQLIDHPVELGRPQNGEFNVSNIPHGFVISDGGQFDMQRLCRDVSRICEEHVAMFRDLPVERYLFLTLATAEGYGGLEHRDSTSLICKRSDLPAPGGDVPDKGYRGFLGLCSHEYFHLWNVKRIQPEVFRDADLASERHTELLWAFEGITSYYDDLALPRSGVLSKRDYLDTFATTVTRVLRGHGRTRQSIAESSFDAWTRFYKQDENAPNAIVSYYAKGALVAFGLDMTLRLLSDERLCLDDLMRRLWVTYGKPRMGIAEHAIEEEVASLLGRPLEAFFNDFVYGTVELPMEDWFGAVGVGFRLRPARNAEDVGGYANESQTPKTVAAYLGVRTKPSGAAVQLSHVYAGGPAQSAGLSAGDMLLAIDGEQLTRENWTALLHRRQGSEVQVHYFRRGRLHETSVAVSDPPADTCDLWFRDEGELDADVIRRRDAWLRSSRTELP